MYFVTCDNQIRRAQYHIFLTLVYIVAVCIGENQYENGL